MSQDLGPIVTVKRDILRYFSDNLDHIVKSHRVNLTECDVVSSEIPSDSVAFRVSQSYGDCKQSILSEIACHIQKYADSLCVAVGGSSGIAAAEPSEDSSYDSDFDTDEACTSASASAADAYHRDVARTVSDTLAAEFAEYVSITAANATDREPDRDPGYTQRVEFALKLGYTEKLVRAALAKLGPSPEQNELLAELIRLGAQCPRQTESPPDGEARSPEGVVAREIAANSGSDSLLRHIVIDGSNVAMSHGNKEVFSCRGIKISVDWFRARGHREITVFVPKWRKEAGRPDSPIADREILQELERERLLVFTPSRLVGGKRLVCYDDRYVLRLAAETDGVVVSNDNYRDLAQENPDFRRVVEERLLMYSFVSDRFMPPDDPLGRGGPDLDRFLRARPRPDPPPPPCPYARKCTYGNKCKFDHPERGSRPHKSVAERLSERAARALRARARDLHAVSLPLPAAAAAKAPLARAASDARAPPRLDPLVAAHFERAQRPPDAGEPVNPHRKLRRRLTPNPPREPPSPPPEHSRAARVASAPAPGAGPPVRAAAAPSASEPALHLWEARRRMHFRLASIFPEEQVARAMAAYPDETDAQKICAVILTLFHKR